MSCRSTPLSSAAFTAARHATRFDDVQMQSVFHQLRAAVTQRVARGRITLPAPPDPDQYQDLLHRMAWRVTNQDGLTDTERASVLNRINVARTETPPDPVTLFTVDRLLDHAVRADHLYRREARFIAGWRGVDTDTAADYLDRTRRHWHDQPADQRPEPPPDWVDTYLHRTLDADKVSPPTDAATVYAVWRAETDPDAFPDHPAGLYGYAVLDLETTGFSRDHDDIIEVGIILLAPDGNPEDRVNLLLSPRPDADGTLNVGPVDVHGITAADVTGKPTFADVAADLRARLDGRCIVAHHTMFDWSMLNANLARAGQPRLPAGPMIDTMRVARTLRLPVPNARLATVADHLGVPYTNGHRALHDADVCWQVLTALRQHPRDQVAA